MRDLKINVLYYPDMFVAPATLKKAILLFDELHFMDRPSFSFGKGQGGLIGAPSPLRQFEASFREDGVPLYVHPAPGGPAPDELYEQIKADVNDLEFLKRVQNGLKTSAAFRGLQIPTGNYGSAGDQDSVAQKLMAVDFVTALKAYESPIALFEDSTIKPFDVSNPVACAKWLIFDTVKCSSKLNFALSRSSKEGFFPLADANPYGDLLGAKYARAINKLEPTKSKIQVTDLTFAIFDELIPTERLEKLTIEDVVRYRKSSEKAREAFLEHVSVLQAKQASIGLDGDYADAINSLVMTEIVPAARAFRNKLQTIGETLFGTIAKDVVQFVGGGSAFLSLFGDLSWQKLILLAGGAGPFIAKASIDAIVAERAAWRECSISYILSLDE